MNKYISAPILALALFLTACNGSTSTTTTPPSQTGATNTVTTPPVPVVISPLDLGLITTGTEVATGAVLNFAITDPTERTKVSNEMYAAANAIYSLSTGNLPTVAQFTSAVLAFGGTQKDANYASFTTSLTALYKTYYTQYNTGNVSNATAVLAAIAQGIQEATQAYITIPTTTTASSTGTATSPATNAATTNAPASSN